MCTASLTHYSGLQKYSFGHGIKLACGLIVIVWGWMNEHGAERRRWQAKILYNNKEDSEDSLQTS